MNSYTRRILRLDVDRYDIWYDIFVILFFIGSVILGFFFDHLLLIPRRLGEFDLHSSSPSLKKNSRSKKNSISTIYRSFIFGDVVSKHRFLKDRFPPQSHRDRGNWIFSVLYSHIFMSRPRFPKIFWRDWRNSSRHDSFLKGLFLIGEVVEINIIIHRSSSMYCKRQSWTIRVRMSRVISWHIETLGTYFRTSCNLIG